MNMHDIIKFVLMVCSGLFCLLYAVAATADLLGYPAISPTSEQVATFYVWGKAALFFLFTDYWYRRLSAKDPRP